MRWKEGLSQMTYRDLIDIPDIPFVPFEERFREPVRASAPPWEGAHPVHVTPKGGPRPNAGRKPKAPRPIADLTHRIAGCEGIWGKTKINKFGHQIVFCWRCKATRIAKREAA